MNSLQGTNRDLLKNIRSFAGIKISDEVNKK